MKRRTKRLVSWGLIAAACLTLPTHVNAKGAAANTNNAATPAPEVKPGGTGAAGGNSNNSNAPQGAQQPRIVNDPATVPVAGRRGDTKKRFVQLQASEPISVTRIITSDLYAADPQAGVMSADKIRVEPDQQSLPEFPRFALVFNLGGVAAGEFTGSVRVVHAKGVQVIPVNVKVRHHWLPPLLVLLTGLALGAWLTAYRTRGRLRDQVLVRVGQLRAQVRTDADLNSDPARPFREQIENHLVDVQVALDAERWADASTAADRAQAVFNNWAKHRPSWLEQLRYHADLVARLLELKKQKAGAPSPYLLRVARGLDDAARDAAAADSPKPFRDRLDVLWQQLNDYVGVQTRIKKIEGLTKLLASGMTPDEVKAWEAKAASLAERLDSLLPGDASFAAAYQSLAAEAAQRLAEISKLIPPGGDALSLGPAFDLSAQPPALRRTPDGRGAARAAGRLRLFTRASYVIALILLAGIGFGELYVARPTFGAAAWGDYFALLAWGFGAEATRASVAQTVRNWGLLGFPSP